MQMSIRVTALLFALFPFVQGATTDAAPAPPAETAAEQLYVVTHIDLIPPQAAPGKALLLQFAANARKDPGAIRVELLQDVSRPNHFTLVTVWQSQKAFEDHLAANHTRAFRTKLQPMLGSPFDERLHHLSP
jgi:quinol monooxygenase YgiN